jgi:hypothetical protein
MMAAIDVRSARRSTRRPVRKGDESRSQQYCFVAILSVVVATALFGGSARDDVPGLMVLYPLSVLLASGALIMKGPSRWDDVRTPMLFLAAFATLMIVQLIPMPPALWLMLPNAPDYAHGLIEARIALPWHSLSIAPDLTLSSLGALSVPAAALVLFAGLSKRHARLLLWAILLAIVCSALLGAAQYAAGPDSIYYLYRIAGRADIVGLFANRNHQALLLVTGFPIVAALLVMTGFAKRSAYGALAVITISSLFLFLMLVLTGSRASLALAAIAIGFAGLILRGSISFPRQRLRWRLWGPAIGVFAVITLVLVIHFGAGGRMPAIDRLFSMPLEADRRAQSLPTLWLIVRDYWLAGSGFGTFDPLFRTYEPDALLQDTFFNHAHNDMIELIITRMWRAVRSTSESSDRPVAQASTSIIFLIGASSFVDYPLRAPILAMMFTIAVAWLVRAESSLRSAER